MILIYSYGSYFQLYIKPLWRKELSIITEYSEEEILPVSEDVWRLYMTSFPAEAEKRSHVGSLDYSSPNFVGAV